MKNNGFVVSLLALLPRVLAVEDTKYRLIALSKPENKPIYLPWVEERVSFYDLGTQKINEALPTPLIIADFIKKESMKFTIDGNEYIVYPMDQIVQIKNKEKVCLGKFNKLYVSSGNLFVMYSDGDKLQTGARYTMILEIAPFYNFSARKYFSDTDDVQIGIRIRTPEYMREITVKNIGFYIPGLNDKKTDFSIKEAISGVAALNRISDNRNLNPINSRDLNSESVKQGAGKNILVTKINLLESNSFNIQNDIDSIIRMIDSAVKESISSRELNTENVFKEIQKLSEKNIVERLESKGSKEIDCEVNSPNCNQKLDDSQKNSPKIQESKATATDENSEEISENEIIEETRRKEVL